MRRIFIAAVIALAACAQASAINYYQLFKSATEMDSILTNSPRRPIYQSADPSLTGFIDLSATKPGAGLTFAYLPNHRALTGESCSVNKLVNVIGVGAWNKDMNALTDDDLDNSAQFNRVAGVALTVDPVASIRDMGCYYAAGEEAGFCLVASSGDAVLSLNVIKAMSIGFYRDGKLMGSKPVLEGQDGSGVTLSLIQIPTSNESVIMVTAKSDWVFDEVMLDRSGGLQVSVANLLKVKYAYVGPSREFTITDQGIQNFQNYPTPGANSSVKLNYVKGWNPVLLGLPFPLLDSELNKFTNDNLDDYAALTPIVAAGYQGGVKFMMMDTNAKGENTGASVYQPGCEVGFNYKFGSGLALDAGAWIVIRLYDYKWNASKRRWDEETVQEENISANVLNLSVAKGGDGTSMIRAKVPFSGAEIRFHTVLGVNLGAMGVHYAFVREKVDTRHHCPIEPSVATNLCDSQSSYQLRSNPEISVTWSYEGREPIDPEFPADFWPADETSVTPDGEVTHLKGGFRYTFRATAADGCWDETVLSVGSEAFAEGQLNSSMEQLVNDPADIDPETGEPIIKYAVSDRIYDSSGALLSISNVDGRDNVVTPGDGYASYSSGLGLASNLCIIGVKRVDGEYLYDSTAELDESGYPVRKRIGFIVESSVTGLDLSALQFLRIRGYDGEREVFSKVIDESNAVSAGLIGSGKTLKIRYSIECPIYEETSGSSNTPLKITEFQLWTSGVLNLGASEIRIYSAFIEDAGNDSSDPLGCEHTMISSDDYQGDYDADVWAANPNRGTHARINADATTYGEGITVANITNNLSYLIDDDPTTPLLIDNNVTVGGGITVAVMLGKTLDYHHQLGIIVDSKTYLAGIGAGSWLTVETYYGGVATGDKFNDWSVLGADVAGYGDKNFLYMQPIAPYDEVRITTANIAGVTSNLNLYGLFIRGDVNNNGVPDCLDDCSCSDIAIHGMLTPQINQPCEGNPLTVRFNSLTVGEKYTMVFSEPGIGNDEQTPVETNYIEHTHTATLPGQYTVTLLNGSGVPLGTWVYKVHPNVTTWRVDASNSDWNKWDNWDAGSPFACTDVIIPQGAAVYPVLDPWEWYAPSWYSCRDIHFEPQAWVGCTHLLNYRRAYVEMDLEPNVYHMLAAPLKYMYTGDMFIPKAYNGRHDSDAMPYFTEIKPETCDEYRFSPVVYQRLYNLTAYNRPWDSDPDVREEVVVDETTWSHNFNELNYCYGTGSDNNVNVIVGNAAFSMWVDNDDLPEDQSFRFRFPKAFTKYHYFNDFNREPITDIVETELNRGSEPDDNCYRFIYEGESEDNETYNEDPTDTRVIFSGCMPLNLRLEAETSTSNFIFGNPVMSQIDVKRFLEDNIDAIRAVHFMVGNALVDVSLDTDGNLTCTGENIEEYRYIRPMTSVILTARSKSMTLPVYIDAEMISFSGREPMLGDEPDDSFTPGLLLTASYDNSRSGAFAAPSAVDLNTILDSEIRPSSTVSFIGYDGAALSMAQPAEVMPLAIFIDQEIPYLALDFTSTDPAFNPADYYLVDMKTDEQFPLSETAYVDGAATSAGRYVVMHKDHIVSGIEPTIFVTSADGAMLTVSSTGEPLVKIEVYTIDGALYSAAAPTDRQAVVWMPRGIAIVKATTAAGLTRSFKILSK